MPLVVLFSNGIFASLLLEKRDIEFQFLSRLCGRHSHRFTAGGKISGPIHSFRGSKPLNTITIQELPLKSTIRVLFY